jgi:hypothetical protein
MGGRRGSEAVTNEELYSVTASEEAGRRKRAEDIRDLIASARIESQEILPQARGIMGRYVLGKIKVGEAMGEVLRMYGIPKKPKTKADHLGSFVAGAIGRLCPAVLTKDRDGPAKGQLSTLSQSDDLTRCGLASSTAADDGVVCVL